MSPTLIAIITLSCVWCGGMLLGWSLCSMWGKQAETLEERFEREDADWKWPRRDAA